MIALIICSVLYLTVTTVCSLFGVSANFLTPLFALCLASSVYMRKSINFGAVTLLVAVNCFQTWLSCGHAWSVVGCYFFSAGIWYVLIPIAYRLFCRWSFLSEFKPMQFGKDLLKSSVVSTFPFFVVSNMFCWLQMSSAGVWLPEWLRFEPFFYEGSLSGLLTCYLYALPFYSRQLIGTVLWFGAYVLTDRYWVDSRKQLVDRWYSLAHLPSPVNA